MKNNIDNEVWKSCYSVGYPQYEVSNYGRVRNILKKNILKITPNRDDGYEEVYLYNKQLHKQKKVRVHRLVLSVFNPNRLVVHHINLDKTDNRLCNLCWLTEEEHNKLHTKLQQSNN